MSKRKETIEASTINRIFDKAHNLIGWAVKSNSDNRYYLVRCKKVGQRCFWMCDCKADKEYGYNGFGAKGRCCHVRAVVECGIARRELRQQKRQAQAVATAEQIVKEAANKGAEVKAAPSLDELKKMPLNGNGGFNLLRV